MDFLIENEIKQSFKFALPIRVINFTLMIQKLVSQFLI